IDDAADDVPAQVDFDGHIRVLVSFVDARADHKLDNVALQHESHQVARRVIRPVFLRAAVEHLGYARQRHGAFGDQVHPVWEESTSIKLSPIVLMLGLLRYWAPQGRERQRAWARLPLALEQ